MNFGEKAARETGAVKVNSDMNSGNVNDCLSVARTLLWFIERSIWLLWP